MSKVLSLLLVFLLHCCHGHSNSLQNEPDLTFQNDADLQAELMPQELNSEFVPGKDSPWRAVIPVTRSRRDTDIVSAIPEAPPGIPHSVKLYSRVASCISLAIAAIIEIVLYVLEFYT